MNNKISVCIIVKNEEEYIKDCLNSVINIACEIIVLDTGSTDRTIEICRSFEKLKIYHEVWENNFSKARNKCISYASGHWILIIDADERLSQETQNNLDSFLDKNHDNNVIYRFKTLNQVDYHTPSYFKSTLFKNNQGIEYIKEVHDHPYSKLITLKMINCPDLVINHMQKNTSIEELKIKALNYIKIMKEQTDKLPDMYDNYYYYRHIGDAYLTLNDSNKALKYYLWSEKLMFSNPNIDKEFYRTILNNLLNILIFEKEEYSQAITYTKKLLAISISNESVFYHALCLNKIGKVNEAIEYAEKYLIIDRSSNESIFYHAFCLNRIGHLYGAIKSYNELLTILINKILKFNIYIELSRAYRGISHKDKSLNYLLLEKNIDSCNHGLNLQLLKHFILDDNLKISNEYYSYLLRNDVKVDNETILKYLFEQKGWDYHEKLELNRKLKN